MVVGLSENIEAWLEMSFDGGERQWRCGKGATHQLSSIVRDIGEPCLHQSSIKMSKMLKPDRWQTIFDKDGKVHGFRKVLKLIILGGVDSAIRPEVWEFLLNVMLWASFEI
ncbi:hypothetical protein K7X08_015008 [Anisodus acutangulus]|uniref:Rab-GAP TBC domain-containing protein n=1 Tax=Anisodus acutangulus TaxID=402998 RepID=A0A9Q1L5A9_9SOLA|nr:hypothetical protein K7X08_015008 [Anisodus acutangulus]